MACTSVDRQTFLTLLSSKLYRVVAFFEAGRLLKTHWAVGYEAGDGHVRHSEPASKWLALDDYSVEALGVCYYAFIIIIIIFPHDRTTR